MKSITLLAGVLARRAAHGIADELSRSVLKTVTVLVGAALLLLFVYAGSRHGLALLLRFEGLGEVLAARMPGLIYLVLAGMLTISAAVTFLGVFFRARETAFLHTLPLSRRTVLFSRWLETLLLSTWAFPAMALPFHVALWTTLSANLGYLLSFAAFMPAFAVLASATGALIACGIVALGPLWRTIRLAALATGGIALVLWALQGSGGAPAQLQDDPVLFLHATLSRFNIGFSPYFPSGWWFLGAEALRAGDLGTALGYFACLASSGLLMVWLLLWLAPDPLYRLWTRWSSDSAGSAKQWGIVAADRLFRFLPPPIRALVVKDLRLLLRDPSQWAQTLLLFGLMGAYVASLRGMSYHNLPVQWRLLVVAANFAAVAGILASLGTRFFFPLPSLEARMAWLVRVAPVRPRTTLWAKVGLAILWTFPPAAAITVGTIIMLGLPSSLVLTALLDVFLIDLTLMSMSVGLGMLLPEMASEEPARIVSGVGGTTALLLGLGYVIASAILVWVQVGWIPWLPRAASFRVGTFALGGISLAVSGLVLHAAARRVDTVEILG
ncbi:hypothetical protein JXA88_06335 [Candidatus Fermentibacteria bacterium]|nr:hypothetical protein [Candidatus Fermentibacteria bacterium]